MRMVACIRNDCASPWRFCGFVHYPATWLELVLAVRNCGFPLYGVAVTVESAREDYGVRVP